MKLIPRSVENITVLELSGNFDANNSPSVRRWFEQAADQGMKDFVVNMAGVNFLDSTGLSILIQAMKRSRQRNGDVRLCCLQQPVRMVFELTRLDRIFEIFNSEEDAVRAFLEQAYLSSSDH